MGKSQKDLVDWSLSKAEEYLSSARENLDNDRLYVAAEEIFRAIETSLEALLYQRGIAKISYPGTKGEFTGRLALQFLARDNLQSKGIITTDDYHNYLRYASSLHKAGYSYGAFKKEELEGAISYAERLFSLAQSLSKK